MQLNPEQKIKQLFDELFHPLTHAAFRYVNSYDQAEEIVQDVFVKVWQNFEKFNRVKNSKAYLYTAVKNSSMNFNKHIEVRRKFIADSIDMNTTSASSHEETILEEENRNKIQKALNKLPEKWREAIILSKYDKLKYHEIAEEMNVSQKTVEKYISKALQVLRKELKDILLLLFIFMELIFYK